MTKNKSNIDIRRLTYLSVLTATVVVLQLVSSVVKFGMFSITFTLIPIVVGAAICGIGGGGWLGFVFGVVVLMLPETQASFSISIPGTVITVLLKGILCGVVAGVVYKLLLKLNKTLSVYAAAIICPLVNTAVYILGSFIFFYDSLQAQAAGVGQTVFYFVVVGIGLNALIEIIVSIVLAPTALLIINRADKNLQ